MVSILLEVLTQVEVVVVVVAVSVHVIVDEAVRPVQSQRVYLVLPIVNHGVHNVVIDKGASRR